MSNIFKQKVIAFLSVLFIVGCQTTNLSNQPNPQDEIPKSESSELTQLNNEALQHMMDGQLYLDQGDFAMAIVELQEAQHLEPNVPSVYLSLSECYWHLKKPERAMEYLDAGLEIAPKDEEILGFKAEQYFRLQDYGNAEKQYLILSEIDPNNADYSLALGDLAKMQKDYNGAMLHYENAYGKGKDVVALELVADLTHRLGKLEKANNYYSKLIKLDSLNVNYLSALSDVKVQLGKADDAVDLVKKVIDIEGSSIERQIQLGVLYGELGKDTEAIKSFEGLLDNDSTSATAMHFLSTIYRENEDYENAQKYADELITLQPDNPQGFINSALVALAQDNPDDAIQILNPAAADFTEEYLIQYLLGLSYHQIKNYKIAAVFLDNARQIVPHSRNALHLLAIANDNLENFDISDGIYQQLIDTDTTDAQALNNFAYSLVVRDEKLELSKKYAKKAIELEPDQAAYLDTYGWILFKLGKSKDALKYIERSLEIDAENSEILDHLGDVYYSLKKYDKAKEYYNKALKLDPENSSLIDKISDL